jgi:hypothetical protein
VGGHHVAQKSRLEIRSASDMRQRVTRRPTQRCLDGQGAEPTLCARRFHALFRLAGGSQSAKNLTIGPFGGSASVTIVAAIAGPMPPAHRSTDSDGELWAN